MICRAAPLAALALAGAHCLAQTPDVLVKMDLHLSFIGGVGRETVFRSYNLTGWPSTIGLNFTLEPGFNAVVTQRLQKISTDADQEQLDESYIEDPGYWRAGKQYLPFGAGRLVRDSVSAGSLQIRVGGDQVPAIFAACQGLKGLPKGVVGRIGGKFGVSFGFGEHFGVTATSLANVRPLSEAPKRGEGWGRIVGLDLTTRREDWTASFEVANFSKGSASGVADVTVSDLVFTLSPKPDRSLSFGWGKAWETGDDVFRIEFKTPLATSVWMEPALRMRNGRILDAAMVIHVKL